MADVFDGKRLDGETVDWRPRSQPRIDISCSKVEKAQT